MHPFNCLIYYQSSDLVLLIMEGFDVTWPIARHLDRRVHVFNIVPYNLKRESLEELSSRWRDVQFSIVMLMNTPEQVDWAKQVGLSALFVNHNCWLDDGIFAPSGTKGKRTYSAIINSRPFNWKRIYLADKIEDLAWIKGGDYTDGQKWHWNPWYRSYGYVNLEPLDCNRVNRLLNRSEMGLILSGSTSTGATGEEESDLQGDLEGACYSTGEYLLCGLPVISTISEGGRDVWLNDGNSVICRPDREGVYEAYRAMLDRIRSHGVDRKSIRDRFLQQRDSMRSTFIEYTRRILERHGIDIDPHAHFKTIFRHKMVDYSTTTEDVLGKIGILTTR